MNPKVSVINIEETIGKTVGKRRPPKDPLQSVHILQETQTALLRSFGHRVGKKGVFRFKTHAEANEWNQKTTKPKKS